ncbi:MAG: hypothetical protein IJ690_01045 [Clostridia bacterium]|nr:hypothetical protein [Clostridia bacterium]
MSEEEKKLFEAIKYKNKHLFLVKVDADFLINSIEKQQKELNNLKEIEKSHKEENGKLRVEIEKLYQDNLTLVDGLKQEKEKNKILDNLLLVNKEEYEFIKNKEDYIHKDIIKEKIAYQNMLWNTPNRQKEYNQEVVEVLEELLEEK